MYVGSEPTPYILNLSSVLSDWSPAASRKCVLDTNKQQEGGGKQQQQQQQQQYDKQQNLHDFVPILIRCTVHLLLFFTMNQQMQN